MPHHATSISLNDDATLLDGLIIIVCLAISASLYFLYDPTLLLTSAVARVTRISLFAIAVHHSKTTIFTGKE